MSKNELRQRALKSRRLLSREEVSSLSELVKSRLLELPEFSRAKTIATYIAKSDEVQTSGIVEDALAGGRRIVVPRSDPASTSLVFSEIRSLAELSPGQYGILEPPSAGSPFPLDRCDLVLVPLVAWDESGHRLGYGKGYFDRALGARRPPVSIGLAFESQRRGDIPQSPTDVALDIIVTERRVIRIGAKRP